jgi:hypothetical protein
VVKKYFLDVIFRIIRECKQLKLEDVSFRSGLGVKTFLVIEDREASLDHDNVANYSSIIGATKEMYHLTDMF